MPVALDTKTFVPDAQPSGVPYDPKAFVPDAAAPPATPEFIPDEPSTAFGPPAVREDLAWYNPLRLAQSVVNPVLSYIGDKGVDPEANPIVADIAAGVAGTGMGAQSLMHRGDPVSGVSDEINRAKDAYNQQAAEVNPGKLNEAIRGVAGSVSMMVPATAVGGVFGSAVPFAFDQANQSVTRAKDRGLSDHDVARYAMIDGALEGGVQTAFSLVPGMAGVEKVMAEILGKNAKTVGKTLWNTFKSGAKDVGAELTEENITSIGQSVNAALSGVDPQAATPESLWQTVKDTTAQTLLTMGLVEGVHGVQSIPARMEARQSALLDKIQNDPEIAPAPEATGTAERPGWLDRTEKVLGFKAEHALDPETGTRTWTLDNGKGAVVRVVGALDQSAALTHPKAWLESIVQEQPAHAPVATAALAAGTPEAMTAAVQSIQAQGVTTAGAFKSVTLNGKDATGLIHLADPDTVDAGTTLDHELFHGVLQMFLSKREYRTMKKTFADNGKLNEEAVVAYYQSVAARQKVLRAGMEKYASPVDKMFLKVQEGIRKLKAGIFGSTAYDIMRDAESGKVFGRGVQPLAEVQQRTNVGTAIPTAPQEPPASPAESLPPPETVAPPVAVQEPSPVSPPISAETNTTGTVLSPAVPAELPPAPKPVADTVAPVDNTGMDVTQTGAMLESAARDMGYHVTSRTAGTGTKYYTLDNGDHEVTVRVATHDEAYPPEHGQRKLLVDPNHPISNVLEALKDPSSIVPYDATVDREVNAQARADATRKDQQTKWGVLRGELGASGRYREMVTQFKRANPQEQRSLIVQWGNELDVPHGIVYSALNAGRPMPNNFAVAVKKEAIRINSISEPSVSGADANGERQNTTGKNGSQNAEPPVAPAIPSEEPVLPVQDNPVDSGPTDTGRRPGVDRPGEGVAPDGAEARTAPVAPETPGAKARAKRAAKKAAMTPTYTPEDTYIKAFQEAVYGKPGDTKSNGHGIAPPKNAAGTDMRKDVGDVPPVTWRKKGPALDKLVLEHPEVFPPGVDIYDRAREVLNKKVKPEVADPYAGATDTELAQHTVEQARKADPVPVNEAEIDPGDLVFTKGEWHKVSDNPDGGKLLKDGGITELGNFDTIDAKMVAKTGTPEHEAALKAYREQEAETHTPDLSHLSETAKYLVKRYGTQAAAEEHVQSQLDAAKVNKQKVDPATLDLLKELQGKTGDLFGAGERSTAPEEYDGDTLFSTMRRTPLEGAKYTPVERDPKADRSVWGKLARHFGFTMDPREAGYVLPDGRMLDLSGKRQGGGGGVRYMDHRELPDLGGKDSTADMLVAKNAGLARVDFNLGMLNITRETTPKQQSAIVAGMEKGRPKFITVEADDPATHKTVYSADMDGNDIKTLHRSINEAHAVMRGERTPERVHFSTKGAPLANPGTSPEAREHMDNIDASHDRKVQGEKDTITIADAMTPEQRKDAIERGKAGEMLLAPEMHVMRQGLESEVLAAINGTGSWAEATRMGIGWRDGRNEMGRALAFGWDRVMTPEERLKAAIAHGLTSPRERTQTRLDNIKEDMETEKARKPVTEKAKQERLKRLESLKAQEARLLKHHAFEVARLQDKLDRQGIHITDLLAELAKMKAEDQTASSKTVRQSIKAIRAIQNEFNSSLGDKVYEFWIAGLLGGPKTNMVNIASNTVHGLWEFVIERNVGALINTVLRQKDGAQLGEVLHIWKGLLLPGGADGSGNAVTMALKAAYYSMLTETPAWAQNVAMRQILAGRDPDIAGTTRQDEHPLGQIKGKKGRVIRWSLTALTMMDEFSKALFGRMDVGGQAYRTGKAQGLTGDALSQHIADEVTDLGSAAWGRALQTATRLTFQTKLGDNAETLSKAIGQNAYLKYVLPFRRTPMNIFMTGVRKSPLGLISTAFKYKGLKDGDEKVRRITENLISLGVTVALANMLGLGGDDDDPLIQVTGTDSFATESQAKREHSARNRPQQSIRFRGGTWRSYARIEPFATPIALVVNSINALINHSRGKDPEANVKELLAKTGTIFTDKTLIRGVSDIVSAIQSPTEMERWAWSFGTSWMPNLVRQSVRAYDPEIRDTKAEGPGAWKQKFTGYGGEIPPKVTPWGENMKKDEGSSPATDFLFRLLSPVDTMDPYDRAARPRNLDRAILAWNNAHPDKAWYPSMPTRKLDLGKREVKLNEDQYHKYAVESGKQTLLILSRRQIDPVKPTDADIKAIQDAITDGRRIAMHRMQRQGAFK